jgi:hypothetical protein
MTIRILVGHEGEHMVYPADICEELNREHANDMHREREMAGKKTERQKQHDKLPRPVQIIDDILTLAEKPEWGGRLALKCSESAEAIRYMMRILRDCQSHLDSWVDVLRTGCTVDGAFDDETDNDARVDCLAMEDLSRRIEEIHRRGPNKEITMTTDTEQSIRDAERIGTARAWWRAWSCQPSGSKAAARCAAMIDRLTHTGRGETE